MNCLFGVTVHSAGCGGKTWALRLSSLTTDIGVVLPESLFS